MQSEILSIGDELLIGQVINTNASFISARLNSIGIEVPRITTLGDNEEKIFEAIDAAWKTNDIVIATGGLGPTHDDISKNVVAKYFKKQLVLDKMVLSRVQARFRTFGIRKMPESNLSQAMVPVGFQALPNQKGTAPGLYYSSKGKTFIILPGVPHEMEWLLITHCLPKLQKDYAKKLGSVIMHRTLLTSGVGESTLSEKIGNVDTFLVPGATLAYLPKISGVRLRISVRAKTTKQAQMSIDKIDSYIRKKIPNVIFGVDSDLLEGAVVGMLKKKKATLCVAESCTGGMLSMRITNVEGSSKVFQGGIISYANEVKTNELRVSEKLIKKYGAVSQECASAMAEGALKKFQTTFALSITGIAGPDGGTKDKPVGTIWIALAEANKPTTAKLFHFGNERAVNRERSADAALNMLRGRLLTKQR
ncbi:MAG: competence/damage-inducible protein A [bacterium]